MFRSFVLVRGVVPPAIFVDVTAMPVLVRVVAMTIGVGTRFRLEWRLDRRHPRIQPAQHLREDMIRGNPQIAAPQLHGYVPVTEVIGRASERARRVAFDVKHALGLCDDLHDPAIRRHEEITAAQNFAAREQERHRLAGDKRRAQPALLSQIERQLQTAAGLDRTRRATRVEAATDLDHQKRK
jgi:hypothetical protein